MSLKMVPMTLLAFPKNITEVIAFRQRSKMKLHLHSLQKA